MDSKGSLPGDVANVPPLGFALAAQPDVDARDNASLQPSAEEVPSRVLVPIAPADAGEATDDDDGPPEEISNGQAYMNYMHHEWSIAASIHVNPWPLTRSLDSYDSWNSGDRERYYYFLLHEKKHRPLTQFESTFMVSYCLRNPQAKQHLRFKD